MTILFTCCRTPDAPPPDSPRLAALPPVMLWAWEQPARLGFLDPRTTGVAFLAATLRLRAGDVTLVPRLQPLDTPPAVKLLAVIRVETDRHSAPAFDDEQRGRVVSEVVRLQDSPRVIGVQIDFDAKTSEREFYRQLLFDVRRALPSDKSLTMTALASWCAGDTWLDDLPIDEAVPMLFRMGADERGVRLRLEANQDLTHDLCRRAYGVAVDEPFAPPAFLLARRRYVFNGKAWTRPTVAEAVSGIQP